MKKFLKKIFQSNLGIKFRNFIGFRVITVNLKSLEKNFSISDAFLWRTDNNFKTIINYSDILRKYLMILRVMELFLFFIKIKIELMTQLGIVVIRVTQKIITYRHLSMVI